METGGCGKALSIRKGKCVNKYREMLRSPYTYDHIVVPTYILNSQTKLLSEGKNNNVIRVYSILSSKIRD